MKKFLSLLVVLGLVSTSVGQTWMKPTLLSDLGPGVSDSVFGTTGGTEDVIDGDTFDVAPLLQSGGATPNFSGFANDTGGPVNVPFDGSANTLGGSVYGNAGDTFSVTEAVINDVTPGVDRIVVEVTALDMDGNPTPWVAAGATDPNGNPWTEWRVDVASNSAGASGGTDLINNTPYTLVGTGFSLFDSGLNSLGSFSPLTLDASNADGVQGVAVIGIQGFPSVAGFDMASVQLYWDVEKVPEPSAGILGLFGVLGMMIFRRR